VKASLHAFAESTYQRGLCSSLNMRDRSRSCSGGRRDGERASCAEQDDRGEGHRKHPRPPSSEVRGGPSKHKREVRSEHLLRVKIEDGNYRAAPCGHKVQLQHHVATPSILDPRRASALLDGSHLTSKWHATMWCSFFT